MQVTEVSIAQLRAALEAGQTTAVELVNAYLARIDAYDGPQTTTALNAVVVRNPEALKEAEASDARRAQGKTLGPLDGIPYTAKDSYLVKGLTAASGSPASIAGQISRSISMKSIFRKRSTVNSSLTSACFKQ